MKVEIWSDYVCPFCYIGKRKFELALEKFAHKDKIEVAFKSFELDPSADPNSNVSTYSMLAAKYGMSVEKAKETTRNVAEQAAAVGLSFHFDLAVSTNTFDAHRLVKYAAQQGKDIELSERLFKAYFTEGENIGNHERLASLAADAGLDASEVLAMLQTDQYSAKVREEETEGSQLGIKGVPFYVIDRKYAVSGAQSPAVFLDTLNKAWEEKHPAFIQVEESDPDVLCTDGYCAPDSSKS
ncbi:putative DsbA family dithiol-disulfide isomerase [Paenibacillus endophyticus]|uniref:Putative DsbA family dithiol-disulfide isomerase n=1 Tax=Paenibacillus endophyticus TaxID=1294268 RepID=A0A7W5C5N0_9BACL|nr:DsbA family oxidoreductase [Paenibacillus endophyticus]MBB3151595.1 putative DsbA family dithiol-disulfide isomerase [Paenibacillus endophyticus]